MSSKAPTIILGTHGIGDDGKVAGSRFGGIDEVRTLLDTFYNHGYRELDTSANYGTSENRLGEIDAAKRFTIHTKVFSNLPFNLNGSLEPTKIAASIKNSLAALKVSSVQTMFLHMPDRQTPLAETARAMDEAQRAGYFKQLGLSNYSPAEVKEYLDICQKNGYIKPKVYQGHYNAIVRGAEKDLIPLLRENGMSFYAFSPAAGGLLSGHASTSVRWTGDNVVAKNYTVMYNSIESVVKTIVDASAKHSLSGHAALLRWAVHHSILDGAHGDAVIFSVSKLSQIDGTLDAIEAGPLPQELVDTISGVFEILGDAAPVFHM